MNEKKIILDLTLVVNVEIKNTLPLNKEKKVTFILQGNFKCQ